MSASRSVCEGMLLYGSRRGPRGGSREGLGERQPVGGELGYTPLTCGECVEPRLEELLRSRAGGGDLLVRPLGEPVCSDLSREVDALAEAPACLGSLVGAAERCAEIDEGTDVLE